MGVGDWQPTAMACHNGIAALRTALAEPVVEQDVAWGVDWGSHGERSCVSIIKKHANGVWEVVASEYGPAGSAIASPRAAPLVEPAVEPVAWMTFDGEGGYDLRLYDMNESYRDDYIKRNGEKYASWVQPLYTSPPQPTEPAACIDWPAGSVELHRSLLHIGKSMAKERSREIGDAWNQLADLLTLLAKARCVSSPPPTSVPLLTDEEFESIRKTCAYQFAEACRSGTTKAKTIMQATEAAVRQKAGL